jgi:hypothetical protein
MADKPFTTAPEDRHVAETRRVARSYDLYAMVFITLACLGSILGLPHIMVAANLIVAAILTSTAAILRALAALKDSDHG